MFFQLMPLHWGLVNRTLEIDGIEPFGRIVPPVLGSDNVTSLIASGKIKSVISSGSTGQIVGRGIIKQIKGGGKLCP